MSDELIVKSEKVEEDSSPTETSSSVDVSVDDGGETRGHKVYDYLNVEVSDQKQRNMANKIYDWAKGNAESDSPEDIMWAIRQLKRQLGAPSFGRSDLEHLFHYITLLKEEDKVHKKIKAFERL